MQEESFLTRRRIDKNNIDFYLTELGMSDHTISEWHEIEGLTPLLQTHFGEKYDGDCTLTSITEVWHFLNKGYISPEDIYEIVRNIAESKFFFKNGTLPIFINNICDHLGYNMKSRTKYFKGMGFSFNSIKKIIDGGMPLILSMTWDGRDYYDNHSVTVLGYHTCVDPTTGLERHFLHVHDNWKADVSFVDFERISFFSSISYFIN